MDLDMQIVKKQYLDRINEETEIDLFDLQLIPKYSSFKTQNGSYLRNRYTGQESLFQASQ